MPLTRTRSFAATLVLALAGAPAIGLAPLPAAQGAPGPPPIVHLAATLPRRARPRRRSRYSRVRRLASRSRDWLHAAAATVGPRRQSLRPRLPLRDSYARGPPLWATCWRSERGAARCRPASRSAPAGGSP